MRWRPCPGCCEWCRHTHTGACVSFLDTCVVVSSRALARLAGSHAVLRSVLGGPSVVPSVVVVPVYVRTGSAGGRPLLQPCLDRHQSWRQRWILNPLGEARDQPRKLVVPGRICFRCAPTPRRELLACFFAVAVEVYEFSLCVLWRGTSRAGVPVSSVFL